MNTLFSRLRKSVALFSVAALLSTLVVVAPASAAWYDAAVAALGDPSYQTMSASEKEAALSRNMSRQDAAVVLHRALGSPMATTMTMETLPFTDKAEIAPYAVNAVLFHTEEGLLQGNPDGTLRPAAGLNRAELVVILDRAGLLGEEMATLTPAQEAEFAGAEWARAAFAKAVAAGVVQGYPDGTLRPAGPVNAAETFVLAYRAFNPSEPVEGEDDEEDDTPYDVTSPLRGGAGSIEVDRRSAGTETEVQEGARNTKVLSFEVEAKDSDVRLSNLRVQLRETAGEGANTRLDRYVTDVTVWQENRQVGSSSASEFSDSSRTYSRSIALTDAVVRQDDKVRFFVAVSAVSNIDSADLEDAEWTINLGDIRFQDATGVVSTFTPDSGSDDWTDGGRGEVFETFIFEDLRTSGQIEVRFSRAANHPEAQTVEVSRTARTNEVLLAEFNVRALATAADFEELIVNLESDGEALRDVLENVTLYRGTTQLDRQDVTSGSDTQMIEFDVDDKLLVAEGSTVTLQVRATVRSQQVSGDPRYDNGTRVKASVPTTGHYAEDRNGDALQNSAYRGSVAGEYQTFFVDGINVVLVSSNATLTTVQGSSDTGNYTFEYDVTAFGSDIYIDVDTLAVETNEAVNGATTFSVNGEAAIANVAITSALSSSAQRLTNSFRVSEGTTERFTLQVAVTPGLNGQASTTGFYEVKLEGISFATSDVNGNNLYASDLNRRFIRTQQLVDRTTGA